MSEIPGSNRRHFLLFGGASALAATAVANNVTSSRMLAADHAESSACELSLAANYCLQNFSLNDFKPLLGEKFKVSGFLFSTALQLHAVTSHLRDGDKRPQESRSEPFSLHFIGTGRTSLSSAIQVLHHPQIGSFNVFVNQIGGANTANEKHYEVVFG
ncbi:DUF6916 family protein [Undibacterium danionis]|uniref:DUF6916 family protein n=1 Tax=Undibacterium danionis TaxID=1812100 RepID=A0ABV6IIV0_9BURK